ncbi:hypothetical protein Ancab_013158, partial [Ancistrocladus abbreviatus]
FPFPMRSQPDALGTSKAVGLPMPLSGALRLKRFAGSRAPLLSKNQEAPNLANNSDSHASGDSLHDSNIRNMNRIHLSKLTHISAEEIWEVGMRLGVHSDEDNHAIIQRIKCLQGNER